MPTTSMHVKMGLLVTRVFLNFSTDYKTWHTYWPGYRAKKCASREPEAQTCKE